MIKRMKNGDIKVESRGRWKSNREEEMLEN